MRVKCSEVKVKFVPKYLYNDMVGTDPEESHKCCKKCCFSHGDPACLDNDCVTDGANGYFKVVKVKS